MLNFLTKVLSSTHLKYLSMISTLISLTPQYDESPGWLGTPWLGTLITVVVSGGKNNYVLKTYPSSLTFKIRNLYTSLPLTKHKAFLPR